MTIFSNTILNTLLSLSTLLLLSSNTYAQAVPKTVTLTGPDSFLIQVQIIPELVGTNFSNGYLCNNLTLPEDSNSKFTANINNHFAQVALDTNPPSSVYEEYSVGHMTLVLPPSTYYCGSGSSLIYHHQLSLSSQFDSISVTLNIDPALNYAVFNECTESGCNGTIYDSRVPEPHFQPTPVPTASTPTTSDNFNNVVLTQQPNGGQFISLGSDGRQKDETGDTSRARTPGPNYITRYDANVIFSEPLNTYCNKATKKTSQYYVSKFDALNASQALDSNNYADTTVEITSHTDLHNLITLTMKTSGQPTYEKVYDCQTGVQTSHRL